MYEKDIITFTIMLLGDSGVGKDTIIKIFNKNKSDDNISSTIGINFSYKEIIVNKKDKIILKLIDTAGQERYRSLTKSYFKNIDAVLFVFSLNDKDTFHTIIEWMESIKNNNIEDVPKYLIGNNKDLEINVEQRLIDEFSQENNIPFISVSSQENKAIDKLFEEIGKKLYLNYINKGRKKQIYIKKFKKCLFNFYHLEKYINY